MHLFNFEKIEHDSSNKGYLIILRNPNNDSKLPILIGSNEAQALSLTHQNIKLPRPRSNQLIINLVNKLDGKFESVSITKYQKGIFYSIIRIKFLDTLINLDSRPSDAVEIAIREGLPIYVDDEVLKLTNDENIIKNQNNEFNFSNQNFNLNEMKNGLMDALNKSIVEENYEIAAKLRDRIKKLNTKKI